MFGQPCLQGRSTFFFFGCHGIPSEETCFAHTMFHDFRHYARTRDRQRLLGARGRSNRTAMQRVLNHDVLGPFSMVTSPTRRPS